MLLTKIENNLPKGMYIPKPLELLFEWIEENDLCVTYKDGYVRGYLSQSEYGAKEGIYFSSENRDIWHFRDNPQAKDRFFPIMHEGDETTDGCIGLWLDDKNNQYIVFIGGDFSVPRGFFILGDVLTLFKFIAIGYEYPFYWNCYYGIPLDEEACDEEKTFYGAYRKWFKKIFKKPIPKTASELLPHFTSINCDDSKDDFLQWDRKHNELWERNKHEKMLYDKINTLFPELELELDGGYYSHIEDISLFTEVIYWLEDEEVDTTSLDIIRRVKELSSWVEALEDDYINGYHTTHIFTEYVVSFLEDIYHNRKLHHLITHICTKQDVVDSKETILGYMSTSEEDYLHVLSLFKDAD